MKQYLLLALMFSLLSLPAFAQQTGDIVWAEWQTNGWYHGTVGEPCGAGFTVNFDDGDVKCCTTAQIVADAVPSAAQVKAGSRVLALWTDGHFYPGTVKAVSGKDYLIDFDDGDKGKATLEQIRLRK